jgi:hypothetical protein
MVGIARLLPKNYLFTILGIAVGVSGLVALGAMAERITRFIDGGDRFVLGQISVAGEGMGMGTGFTAGGLLRAAKIEQIAQVPGVAAVQAQVMLPLNPTTSQFLTLTQELVLGIDPATPMPNRQFRELPVKSGRFLRANDRGVAVVGADFAATRKLAVGGRLELAAGRTFEVVGVLDKTLTAPDRFAIIPLDDARDLWLRRDPLLVQVFAGGAGMGRRDLNTGAAVAWADGVDADDLARRCSSASATSASSARSAPPISSSCARSWARPSASPSPAVPSGWAWPWPSGPWWTRACCATASSSSSSPRACWSSPSHSR